MFKPRFFIPVLTLIISIAVAYADQPLGVTPASELERLVVADEVGKSGATVVPAIPLEPSPDIEPAPEPATEDAEKDESPVVESAEAVEGKAVQEKKHPGKPRKKNTAADLYRMPDEDRRAVKSALGESTRKPRNSAFSESKTVYAYTPDAIFTVYAAPGRVVDIQLQPGERLSGAIIAGDTVRWVTGTTTSGSGANTVTHILIKPVQVGIETNFIITTDRRTYHLLAKAISGYYLPSVAWLYPHDEMAKMETYNRELRIGMQPEAAATSPLALNFRYRIKPDDDYPWTPAHVFDDGQKTYLQMGSEMKNTEAPVFFIKENGTLNIVNYRIKGDYFIIDRLFSEGELRCGKSDLVRIERESS